MSKKNRKKSRDDLANQTDLRTGDKKASASKESTLNASAPQEIEFLCEHGDGHDPNHACDHSHDQQQATGVYVISGSGAVPSAERLDLGASNLRKLGFKVKLDKDAAAQESRFAGTDTQRLAAIRRSIEQPHPVVMASRGGYGMTRLLPHIDWKAVAQSGKCFVGHSDFTAFNLALLAKTGAVSYTGPNASTDFGVAKPNSLTSDLFVEVMRDELEILSFESPDGDAFDGRGVLWGGNLAMLVSLLGTPYFPKVRKGILFVEDINEHPYRVERMLLQLLQAGVLGRQKALLMGHFTGYRLAEHDRGYDMQQVIEHIRKVAGIPVITGLPYGHTPVKATLPIGARVGLATEDGMGYLVLQEH